MPKIQILWIVLGWRSFLFLIELGAGIWSHSLSLLAASGHLFSDLVNLGLTLLVTWLVDCKSEEEVIFEYRGIEIWVAIFFIMAPELIAVRTTLLSDRLLLLCGDATSELGHG
ncbi:MAG TPA: hypothetical protein DDW76_38250 [Cyanobacteria bacterium UBA11369]|nr:hypothetical protein [Cyanobacteria bacterium UBA11369]